MWLTGKLYRRGSLKLLTDGMVDDEMVGKMNYRKSGKLTK